MKKHTFLFTALFAVLLTVSTISAKTYKSGTIDPEKKDVIADNLIVGLKSANDGLKLSSAFYLGEYQAEEALIPLMQMLREGKTTEERITAALALYKIGNPRGIFMLRGMARFDDDVRLSKICAKFYNAYHLQSKL